MIKKVLPESYTWEEDDLAELDVSYEQMAAWDRAEEELQDEEAFRYTCPCCTNKRLENHPRIDTNSDTLRTRTYPVSLQDGEDTEDVFTRDKYVVNLDDADLVDQAQDGSIDGYFRRHLYCEEHEEETSLEYVGRGEGRIDRRLIAELTVE